MTQVLGYPSMFLSICRFCYLCFSADISQIMVVLYSGMSTWLTWTAIAHSFELKRVVAVAVTKITNPNVVHFFLRELRCWFCPCVKCNFPCALEHFWPDALLGTTKFLQVIESFWKSLEFSVLFSGPGKSLKRTWILQSPWISFGKPWDVL